MCRKIQGVRWNDLREHSLTSDYYDYLQFYRKTENCLQRRKDQIKALSRGENTRSFCKRLSELIKVRSEWWFRSIMPVVRQIIYLLSICKLYRADLRGNPMFADSISKFETNNARSHKRLQGLYEKYKREGGEMTPELRENLNFYQM